MLALVHAEIKPKPNQGKERICIVLFTTFLQKMDESYEEALTEFVLLGEPNNSRVTSEFVVNDSIKKLTKTHQSA
jgi:hypothetical protein